MVVILKKKKQQQQKMFRRLYQEMQVEVMKRRPYEDIFLSLDEIHKKLQNRDCVDWRFVRLHLGITLPSNRDTTCFFDLCLYLFRLLREYQCKDFSVIADTLQIYCFEYEGSRKSFNKSRAMINYLINNKTCSEKNGLNFIAKLMKMPYRSSSFVPYEPMSDVIQMHILSREVKYFKFLLEFGVMYIPLSDHRSTWRHCFERLVQLIHSENEMLVSLRDFHLNIRKLSSASRRRMLAVFRAVEIILKSREEGLNNGIEYRYCFRMAYETIPEPVIRSEEVASFLYNALSGPPAVDFIETLCKEYEELFPESTEIRAPRSLKHLCRCQVRQNFREASIFPFGVLDLNYPQIIKDYILAVDNDDIKKEYTSPRE